MPGRMVARIHTCLCTCLRTCLNACLSSCRNICRNTSPKTCPNKRLNACLYTCAGPEPGVWPNLLWLRGPRVSQRGVYASPYCYPNQESRGTMMRHFYMATYTAIPLCTWHPVFARARSRVHVCVHGRARVQAGRLAGWLAGWLAKKIGESAGRGRSNRWTGGRMDNEGTRACMHRSLYECEYI